MLEKTRWFLRKTFFRIYRSLKHPRRLKGNPVMQWFARHFLDKAVWRPCQATFAGGAAIGVFVSMQLIPGQIPLGIVLAAIFRVNIPTAVLLSWISNPLTFAPLALAERALGDWMLAFFGDPMTDLLRRITNPDVEKGVRFARSMYLGGLLSGLLLAPLGYLLGWVSWTGVARLLRLHRRKSGAGPARGEKTTGLK